MQILRLSPAECEELYHTALPRDFPAAELKPFVEIKRLLEAGVYEPLLLADDAGTRLAYAWQVVLPGQRTALLDYFAVRYDLRGGGVGTAAHRVLPAGGRAGNGTGKPRLRHAVRRAVPALRRNRPRCGAVQGAERTVQGHGAAAVLSRERYIYGKLRAYYPPKGGMDCETEPQAIR